ncbi:MAG: hypothetical protein FWF59_12215 [Turicibacter sp.]|nr:hypothetical protein [Turicibacter sp.]
MLAKILEVEDTASLQALEGFEFDWSVHTYPQTKIFSAQVQGEIAGLIEFERMSSELYNFMYLIEVSKKFRGTTVAGELLAFIAMDSFQNGFDGFVVFESKTVTYKYYIEKYGAKPLPGRRLHFDSQAAAHLIKTYLEV